MDLQSSMEDADAAVHTAGAELQARIKSERNIFDDSTFRLLLYVVVITKIVISRRSVRRKCAGHSRRIGNAGKHQARRPHAQSAPHRPAAHPTSVPRTHNCRRSATSSQPLGVAWHRVRGQDITASPLLTQIYQITRRGLAANHTNIPSQADRR
eukprot:6202447-Pleurochrysis_carterae.AAC.4